MVTIMDLEKNWAHKGTFANVKSLIKKINGYFDIKGYEIHSNLWTSNIEKILHKLIEETPLINASRLKSEMFTIGKVIRLATGDETFSQKCAQLSNVELPQTVKVCPVKKWHEIAQILENHIQYNTNNQAKIICTCYKYGYVMKLGEIINTTTKDDGIHNFLDLDNKKWYIRIHKNVRIGSREFSVSDEFVQEISEYLFGDLLIGKSNGKYYGGGAPRTLKYYGINDITNADIRNSWIQNSANTDDPLTIDEVPMIMLYSKSVPAPAPAPAPAPEPEPTPTPAPEPAPEPTKIKPIIKLKTH
jgi:hypothetical protein